MIEPWGGRRTGKPIEGGPPHLVHIVHRPFLLPCHLRWLLTFCKDWQRQCWTGKGHNCLWILKPRRYDVTLKRMVIQNFLIKTLQGGTGSYFQAVLVDLLIALLSWPTPQILCHRRKNKSIFILSLRILLCKNCIRLSLRKHDNNPPLQPSQPLRQPVKLAYTVDTLSLCLNLQGMEW